MGLRGYFQAGSLRRLKLLLGVAVGILAANPAPADAPTKLDPDSHRSTTGAAGLRAEVVAQTIKPYTGRGSKGLITESSDTNHPPATTTPPRPDGSFGQAASSNGTGSDTASSDSDAARRLGQERSDLASRERSVAGGLSSAASRINEYTQPRLASPDPQIRDQAQNYLSQPAEAPAGQEQIYKGLGLETNRDIVDKSPQYVKNLEQSADANSKDAKNLDTLAKQSDAAAAQMKQFAQTLEQRNSNMQSVSDQTAVSASRKGGAADPNSISASAAAQGSGADGSTGQIGFGLDPLASNDSSMTGGKLGTNGKSGAAADGANGTARKGGGRSPSSLAEQLRASLNGKNENGSSKDGGAAAEPKSAFDGLFDANAAGAGKDGRSGISAEGAGGRTANAAHAFSLAGSDTDRAVRKLLGNLNGQGSDAEIYGNVDQSIFVRMKKYLTKAQVDKKVGEK